MSTATVVKRLPLQDAESLRRWDEFVLAQPQATFFHRGGWQQVISEVWGHACFFLFAERAGQVVGVLPLAEVKSRLFGHSVASLPFAVYGGVLALDDEAAAALEAEADRIARGVGAEHLEMRQMQGRHDDWPRQDLYVTFRKPILDTEEANMNAIPRKQRAMVRKGIKNGLQSQVDSDAGRFFALYADNVHRHGTPAMPRRWFEALLKEFGADAEVLTVSDANGRPLSSVLSFYFRDEVLPYYAGDDEAARDLAANDFKYWELMRRACERGLKLFDYGRSKQGTGSYSFKKNWGFEPTPLVYEYRLYKREAIPQNNPNNAKYQLLIKTWRRLPIGVANWLGPKIVRSLG
ncbi:FemAB family XrtA/PEP-CTERM system-associated protein [Pelomonas sp. SE-A7]|uniref:FemAB family XrtA/PEP-CTERM system-associated protein n=1 Tax=Pelomonas sp. SE-A7 TaxID=3054953 RepID=UPI00259C7A22|nr:FemAB family XrtA/PEP-CTERM system-associated protein [Pelomonas sp. SE-A7]MDM4764874.1 FemAB family PEP-CTERM system-associated protein [Pelomonas sp. SE-A7]